MVNIVAISFWGTFFPNLEGFEEIMNPEWEMFRMYVPDTAAFSKSHPEGVGTHVCFG